MDLRETTLMRLETGLDPVDKTQDSTEVLGVIELIVALERHS
jgi:hypothetical protein